MNWALVIGGIVAVAIIGIIVYFVVFKKAGLGIFGGTASSQSAWNSTPTGQTSISITPQNIDQLFGPSPWNAGAGSVSPSQQYIYQPIGSVGLSDPSKSGYVSPHGF